MKKITLLSITLFLISYISFGQTKTVTVDANDVLNNNTKIVAQTAVGQNFFTGHQLGTGYANTLGISRAWTDNPYGPSN